MENNQLPSGGTGRELSSKIEIKGTFCGKYRVFAAFVICAAILTAAFAASAIWGKTSQGTVFFARVYSFFSKGDESGASKDPPVQTTVDHNSVEQKPPIGPQIPDGAIAVVSKDLSYLSRGEEYFLNETPYQPNVAELLARPLALFSSSSESSLEPLVLILHTHTVEAYTDGKLSYIESPISSQTYSASEEENMIAVGRVLCEQLNQNGIPTLHCTVVHTGDDMSLQGSYERAKKSIERYLALYPSIRLVIDLHRDAVMTEDGEYVRSAIPGGEDNMAQVMAVVGTDCNGTNHERWQDNLALALQLRRELNGANEGIGRPVYLRNSSFNQECAPYSLLLEIGTGANSLEQAKCTAKEIGDALARL